MSVAVTLAATVSVVETLPNNTPSAPDATRKVTHTGFNMSKSLNAASTPPATLMAAFEQALSSGAATIDLTALTGTNGATVNMNGLKVQAFKIKAKTTNANPITLTAGASNGIDLLGSSWSVTLQPGQEFLFYGNDATPDVASGDRTIDLAGTGTQAVEVIVVAG